MGCSYITMKSKVRYSGYVKAISIILPTVILAAGIISIPEKPIMATLLSLFIILAWFAAFYGAAYISANEKEITLGSLLRRKRLLMRDVDSVVKFQPTLGAIRVCGSGGYFGYWGIYREGDTGRYYAFYGKSSECFLVKMKNGDKYVLGCENCGEMREYIDKLL